MAETYTANKSLAMVTVGTDPGTWGPFVNLNPQLLDNMLGGLTTIPVLNAPVILSSAQYQCAFIRFTGAITADIALTFPGVGSFYTIINDTTNSSNFCLTMTTTAAGSRTIGIPPGAMTQVMTDGTNPRYTTLPPVGSYWDYGGSSVPRWVASCTIAPFLNCDGTAFSSATYPNLHAVFNNSNVLPDLRGRTRAYMNQGTGRMTAGSGGVDGNTLNAAGGADAGSITIAQANLPNYALTVTDPGHVHAQNAATLYGDANPSIQNALGGNLNSNAHNTVSAVTGITVNSGGGGVAMTPAIMQPTTVGGITLVRSA